MSTRSFDEKLLLIIPHSSGDEYYDACPARSWNDDNGDPLIKDCNCEASDAVKDLKSLFLEEIKELVGEEDKSIIKLGTYSMDELNELDKQASIQIHGQMEYNRAKREILHRAEEKYK